MRYKLSAPATLHTTIQLPASKSISNRALILHALAQGHIAPSNLSDCDDTRVMIKALDGNPGHIDILAAGTAMLSILAVTAVKAFSISRRQKNRLGFLVGTACSVVLTIQMIVYVAANFGVPLVEPMTIPFLSYGGQSTLVNYILLGLILSVYRNKDIVSERHGTRGKWKIRLERLES